MVFEGNYDGGDFCSGLIFGKAGSKMLMEMANRFIKIPDDHNPALKPQEVVPEVKNPKGRVTDEFLKKDKKKHDKENDKMKKSFLQ